MIDVKDIHLSEAIDLFCNVLHFFGLSSQKYFYVFDQYFPRALTRYADDMICKYETRSFARLYKPDNTLAINLSDYSTLDQYIYDYLYLLEQDEDFEACPPFDYLWDNKQLGKNSEGELTFWICRFIIDVCDNTYARISNDSQEYSIICDSYAETQEDLFYCAVYSLFKLYLCHNYENDN